MHKTLTLAAATLAMTLATPAFATQDPVRELSFDRELELLSGAVACSGGGNPDASWTATIEAHCKALDGIFDVYRDEWLVKARPFFADLVPKDLPKDVVYPFGGADLLTVLVVYPDLDSVTTISLEAAGDPRSVTTIEPKALAKSLKLHRQFLDKLVTVNHSRTLDLGRLKGDPLPSDVIFALVGLEVLGYEPVSLKYFNLTEDGAIHYLTNADVARGEASFSGKRGSSLYRARAELFGNVEIAFKKKGEAGAKTQFYRHIQANLDDQHLKEDDRVLDHLRAKGKVAAITKAASYLLWWGNFDTIRDYLLEHLVWMVSDSTGIPPNFLDTTKFELTTYGKFRHTAIKGSAEGESSLREAFETQPQRPLPFMFGYPSKAQHPHLFTVRRK